MAHKQKGRGKERKRGGKKKRKKEGRERERERKKGRKKERRKKVSCGKKGDNKKIVRRLPEPIQLTQIIYSFLSMCSHSYAEV